MAKLVQIIGMTHNPFLPNAFKAPDKEEALVRAEADYARMKDVLENAKPDILLVVASDHLNLWFFENMPAFLVGKGEVAQGPFPHEQRNFGLAPYKTAIDRDIAEGVIREGSEQGVDFAFSSGGFLIDHSFTVPLNFVRPQMDLPIVPIWTNVMALPVPKSKRFYAVGEALRATIEALPDDRRVGVISSGHLAIELGGPRTTQFSADPEFDRHMMGLIAAGEAQQVVKEATWERLLNAIDYKTLYGLGAHPFLLNGFLMRTWQGDQRSFMAEYRKAVAPLGYPDHNV